MSAEEPTPRQTHLAPVQVAYPGTAALCGYLLTGEAPGDEDEMCPRCTELVSQPTPDALLVTVEPHTHTWESGGASVAPGGWSPAYRCTVCGHLAMDINILREVALP